MGVLLVSSMVSLDGYVADRDGNFDWAEPDAEVHGFVNELLLRVGTYLLGRRLYETMVVWETWDVSDQPDHIRDFAAYWRGAEKIVYSRTLDRVTGAGARLERRFDIDAVRRMKASSPRDIEVGGPGLAAHAFRAGLVDEICEFVVPTVVGGGTALLPPDVRLDLELLDERRFGNGFVFLRYRVRR